jgi:hypothetical protein
VILKIEAILGASILLLVSVQVNASIYEYSYTGNTLLPGFDATAFGYTEYWPAYEGVMRIDEEELDGGTLVNSTISFSTGLCWNDCINSPFGELAAGSEVNGLLAFDIFPVPATAGAFFSFTTDYNRNIVSWDGYFLDGPPDGAVSSVFGDFIEFRVNADIYSGYYADAGTWSAPSPVPVPAAFWLFGAALIGLAGFSNRRKI